MSTIKSSNEHLTLNADGSSKDIKFQANGVEKASISSAGAFTSTTIDATKLTGNLPAISAASLTNIPAANITGTLPAISGASLTGLKAGTAKFQAKGYTSGGGTWYAVAANTIIVMAGEHSDDDSCYNISDGKYTAPNAGVYFFYANIYTANADGANGFAFRKNDSQTGTTDAEGTGTYSGLGTDDHSVNMAMVISLGTDDTVSIYTNTGSDWYSGHSYWGGFRLK